VVSVRTHVVSLVVVLIALAAGVVLGAGPLSAKVSAAVSATPSATPGLAAARAADAAASRRLAYETAVVGAAAPTLAHGALAGARVTVLVVAGVPATTVAATTASLTAAGATVGGVVTLTPAWTDPAQSTVLAGIATRLSPGGEVVTGLPSAQADAVLAGALLTRQGPSVGVANASTPSLLAGLEAGGFLAVTGHPELTAADAVLLVPRSLSAQAVAALGPLAAAAHAAGEGAEVLGPIGSGDAAGAIGQLRASAALVHTVSMVDTDDTAGGQLAAVLALAQQRAGGVGQYGDGLGVTAALPSAPASPSPAASPAG